MRQLAMLLGTALISLPVISIGCASGDAGTAPVGEALTTMNRIAEAYVKLVLAVGEHDADYVDAYHGPDEWRAAVRAENQPLAAIRSAAAPLIDEVKRLDVSGEEEIVRLRQQYLLRQLQSMVSRVQLLEGARLSFDEESKALYDAVSPAHSEDHYRDALERLEKMLPGKGPLVDRYRDFKSEFVIPKDRLDKVFTTAIDEARRRTRANLPLPEQESFRVEYVTDKSWSGYNWFKGKGHSLIQVNTDLPIDIDRAIDLACHEGYPGHHVYNVLLEHHLAGERGWVEFTVYPLFSPQSLISEGSANYGREVAFSREERIAYERDVLFPLAGLDPSRVEAYYDVEKIVKDLRYAGNDAARRYLDGQFDRGQIVEWLSRYSLMSAERAEQRVKFIDQYRAYVINYNLGEDLVRSYIEGRAGADDTAKRWEEFGRLLSSPRLPSGLDPS